MVKQTSFFFGFIFFMTALFLGMPLKAQQADSGDVALMRERIRELVSANPPSPGRVQQLLKTMRADGSWESIDYRSIRVSHWPAGRHLTDYVLPLAKAFANPDSPLYQDKKLAKGIHKSLGFWLDHNFTSRNWWPNEIGVPKRLCNILILMGKEVTSTELLQALNQMRGSDIRQTGQNRVWRAENQLKIGLLTFGVGRVNILGSPKERIREASSILKEEVVVRAKEGIQPDWSFHQHGVQQQFGNYGLSYASSQAQWAWILKDTPFQYSRDKIGILRNYVLNGLSRVAWKGIMDISGIGRQIFPDSPAEKGQAVINVLQMMAKADPEHAPAYQAVAGHYLGKAPQPSWLKGNIYFWRSAMMVDRSETSYISVRMSSKKIQSTESGNGENLLGTHLSDGATYLYRTAEEYRNIFPVWDWHRIPGVTAYSEGPLPQPGWRGLKNGSDFVGGVSDSTYGDAVMLFRRNGLSAHKSWFFVPGGLVCLGAGIESEKNVNVSTTVNQSLLNGAITVKTGRETETLSAGKQTEGSSIDWVHHNRTGYLFLQKEQVYVGAAHQQGNWNRVYEDGSEKPVMREVFNLWVDHGSSPRDGSYAYMVLPGISRSGLANLAARPSVEVLQNTTSLQAVRHSKAQRTQMVFYEPGTIRIDDTTVLSADASCLLMTQKTGDGLKIMISAPPQLPKNVTLSLSGHFEGKNSTYDARENRTTVIFNLPEGIYAGKSITRMLTSP